MFEWDEANTEHITRHGIAWWEVEEAYLDPVRFVYNAERREERRIMAVGRTESGRTLAVLFVTRPNGNVRVVTAREANRWEQRQYREKGGKHRS